MKILAFGSTSGAASAIIDASQLAEDATEFRTGGEAGRSLPAIKTLIDWLLDVRLGSYPDLRGERSLPLPLLFGGPTIGCSAPVNGGVHADPLLLARRFLGSPSYRS
jgi:hypothetical protein